MSRRLRGGAVLLVALAATLDEGERVFDRLATRPTIRVADIGAARASGRAPRCRQARNGGQGEN